MVRERYKVGIVAILLAGVCLLTYYFHAVLKTGTLISHIFYIPIILSAVWWKRKGLIVAVFSSAFLVFSHFYLRPDVADPDDYFRAFMFLVIAFVVTVLSEHISKAEQALKTASRQSEIERDKAQQYLDTAGVMFVAIDANQKVTLINKKGCEVLGYRQEEILGKNWLENFIPERLREDVTSVFNQLMAGEIEPVEYFENPVLTRSGEERIISWHNTVICDDQSRIVGALGAGVDVTERKRAEEKREKLTELLAEKNRELEEIIRVATHDLRTPMVNIEGFGRILTQSCEQIPGLIEKQRIPEELSKQLDEVIEVDIPEAVGIINSGVSKMNSLLKSMLRLAKLGYSATEMVKLDMDTKIENIIDTMRFQAEQSGAEIKVEPLPSCLGDKAQINQVFSNLLANALNFLDSSRPGLVRITGRTEENYSVYCVEDNGIGIAADNIDNIFRMFYRVRSADDDGEGLGLAIVRRIVNRHNGKVWAESEAGKGSKFFVKLPRQ